MRILTDIAELDSMLFGELYDRNWPDRSSSQAGFSPGQVVLIRGEPGSGKTTLALQIASNVVKRDGTARVRFLSMEEQTDLLKRRCQTYGFGSEKFEWSSRAEVEKVIRKNGRPGQIGRAVKKTLKATANEWATILPPGPQAAVVAAAVVFPQLLEALVKKIVGALLARVKTDVPRLVVIDSINALMNVLIKGVPGDRPRLLFNTFCEVLRQEIGAKQTAQAPVIIIIGEHHFHEPDTDKYLPESFFCDAEIVLRPEPVRISRDADAAEKMTLGYDIAAVVNADAGHIESRSFCRVLKSRTSPNQSRRCAYDIEPGRGIRFFETYPGDGKLMLFAENEQQRSAWTSFFQRDLTDAYPALRYEVFTMLGMEPVYESSRRLRHVPLRTDMFLSSLDSYWVVGYRDYSLKTKINERVQLLAGNDRTMHSPSGQRTPKSVLACHEYPVLVNDLVHYAIRSLEVSLFRETRAELARRPRSTRQVRRDRVQSRLETLERDTVAASEELESLRREIRERHDWLCRYLTGRDAEAILDDRTLLPGPDLRESFLRPLPRSKISLYGEYNADILPSLTREDMHQFVSGEDHWLCVPYDANIGIFVARIDLLKTALSDPKRDDTVKAFRSAYDRLKADELEAFESILRPVQGDEKSRPRIEFLFSDVTDEDRLAIRKAVQDEILRLREDRPPIDLPPLEKFTASEPSRLSWDEVIALSAAVEKPIGIETRSFDTLLAFFLELVWNCGGELAVNARYQVREKPKQIVPLIRALHYFRAIFEIAKTPPIQTIDSSLFHSQPGGLQNYGNWLFSRYWYSTLVDALTAKHKVPGTAAQGEAERLEFTWRNTGAEPVRLSILRMPSGREGVGHFSCWGEWNFALVAGSENVTLACDLVSNLMSVLKVTERGLHGACLPTVSQFYWRFRDEHCVPATIRGDIVLPTMTFGQLGQTYLGTPANVTGGESTKAEKISEKDVPKGIFRQAIFDYRHCAREIYGELLQLKGGSKAEAVADACARMLRGIEQLRYRYIFIRDAFRQDVAETPLQGADRRDEWTTKERRDTRIPVDVAVGQGAGMVRCENISATGWCRVGINGLAKGRAVSLKFGKYEIRGSVKWTSLDGTRQGIEFESPLGYQHFSDVLASIGAAQ